MIYETGSPSTHRFDHEAMNTLFSLRIAKVGRDQALRAAGACFRKLDHIEGCLSRYRDDSDISRINAMSRGESLFIDEDTCECLRLAIEASVATAGLFDVTLGAQIEHRKREDESEVPELTGIIQLAPDRPLVHCVEPGRQIDLGGIGKGLAIDRMAEVLREHGIDSALLSCAGSTLLALGHDKWPVVLKGDSGKIDLELMDSALSASGAGFQGNHVLRPDSPGHAYNFRRVWIVAASAALADAFSTASLIMDEDELAEFASSPSVKSCFAEPISGSGIARL